MSVANGKGNTEKEIDGEVKKGMQILWEGQRRWALDPQQMEDISSIIENEVETDIGAGK